VAKHNFPLERDCGLATVHIVGKVHHFGSRKPICRVEVGFLVVFFLTWDYIRNFGDFAFLTFQETFGLWAQVLLFSFYQYHVISYCAFNFIIFYHIILYFIISYYIFNFIILYYIVIYITYHIINKKILFFPTTCYLGGSKYVLSPAYGMMSINDRRKRDHHLSMFLRKQKQQYPKNKLWKLKNIPLPQHIT